MISFLGYSFHAIYPLALLGVPLGAVFLVHVYRSLGDTQKTVISSLFLLRDLPRASPGRKKFIPPPQFWIELLSLLVLALAAAGIIAAQEGQHIAIVLDTSLSMSATNPNGDSRLEEAKKQALTHLNQAPSSHRFSVFEARGTAHRVTALEVSHSEASEAIRKISYSIEQDRLAGTIESLYSSGDFDGVWLYTDHLLSKSTSDPNAPVMRITSLPSTDERQNGINLWVSDIVETSIGENPAVVVQVQGSTPTPIAITVTVSCYLRSLNEQIGDTISKQTTVSNSTPSNITIESLPKNWRFCKAVVLPNSTSIHDSIADDNSAWITHASTQAHFALLSPLATTELGLDKLKTPAIIKETVPNTGESSERKNRPTIFHRVTLPSTAPPPAFAILPPPGELPWGGRIASDEVMNAEITRWSTSHPILQYLNIATVVLPSVRVITCPNTSTPILFTREGSIGCAGDSPSGRYVILGFEVFPFDGGSSPAASILVLNILKWLLQDLALDNRPRAPGYQLLPAGTVTAKEIGTNRVVTEFDDSRRILLTGSTLIEFLDQGGNPTGQAASLFSSSYESDTRGENELSVNLISEKNKEKKNTSSDMWRYPALAALLFIGWDIIRKLQGKSRWEAP